MWRIQGQVVVDTLEAHIPDRNDQSFLRRTSNSRYRHDGQEYDVQVVLVFPKIPLSDPNIINPGRPTAKQGVNDGNTTNGSGKSPFLWAL